MVQYTDCTSSHQTFTGFAPLWGWLLYYFCSLFPLPVSVLPPPSSALTCPWLVVALLLLLLSCLLVCWCLLSAAGHLPFPPSPLVVPIAGVVQVFVVTAPRYSPSGDPEPLTLELHAPTSPICAAFSFLVPFCPPGLLLSPSAASWWIVLLFVPAVLLFIFFGLNGATDRTQSWLRPEADIPPPIHLPSSHRIWRLFHLNSFVCFWGLSCCLV